MQQTATRVGTQQSEHGPPQAMVTGTSGGSTAIMDLRELTSTDALEKLGTTKSKSHHPNLLAHSSKSLV